MTDFNLKRWPNSDDYNLCMDETVIQERLLRRKAYENYIWQHYDSQSGKLFDALDLRNTRKSLSEDHTWLPQFLDLIRRPQSYDYKLVHDPSCVLHLPFWAYKNPTIPYIYDLSGNNNHGIITGAVPAIYPMLSGQELVTNGGMELDSDWPSYGTPTTNERSNVQVHSGTYSRHVVCNAANSWGIKQSKTFTVGKKYKIPFWYYLIPGKQFNALIYDNDGGTVIFNSGVLSTTGVWTYVEGIATSTVSGVDGLIVFTNNGVSDTEFYADDVSVQEVVGYTGLGWGFDGLDDKVVIPYNANLNTSVFTSLIWTRVTGNKGSYRSQISNRDGIGNGYVLYANNVDQWSCWIYSGVGATSYGTTPVNHDTWTLVAIQHDGTNAKMYINGIYDSGGVMAYSPQGTANLSIGAGANEGAGDYWDKGAIGEVLIFNRVLSAQENRNYFELTRSRYGV